MVGLPEKLFRIRRGDFLAGEFPFKHVDLTKKSRVLQRDTILICLYKIIHAITFMIRKCSRNVATDFFLSSLQSWDKLCHLLRKHIPVHQGQVHISKV